MLDRNTVTEQDIKEWLIVHFQIGRTHNRELKEAIYSSYDIIDIRGTDHHRIFLNWYCGLMANRLKQSVITTSLVTLDDLMEFSVDVFYKLQRTYSVVLSQKNFQTYLHITRLKMEVMGHILRDAVLPDTTEYEERWRWIEILLQLAQEHNQTPQDLLDQAGIKDEITRRMYTKEQFDLLGHIQTAQLADTEMLWKFSIQPVILETTDEPELMQNMEQLIRARYTPALQRKAKQLAISMRIYFELESIRIYGP